MAKHHYTYLALGDSYTVGEGVSLYESFPYQLINKLRSQGYSINAPEIIARTGWSTIELAEYLLHIPLSEKYDFVTLQVGVNNQYRKLSLKDFENDFEFLLKKAIHLAGEKPQKVIVLSIPDWGVVPAKEGANVKKVSNLINMFNEACLQISDKYGVDFIDITEDTRNMNTDMSLVAVDRLHPSGKQYGLWVDKIMTLMEEKKYL